MNFLPRFSYLIIATPIMFFAQSVLALTISDGPTVGVTITTDDVKRVTTYTGAEINANVNKTTIENSLISHNVVITDVRDPDITLAANTILSWSSANDLIVNAHKDINLGYGAQIISNGYNNLILRADYTADNNGTIIPGGTGPALLMKGGGNLRIYYHPADYAIPTDFSSIIQLTAPATANAFMAINDFGDMQKINRNLSGKYGLAANIDANGARFSPIGTAATPFTGMFDGQGFRLSNFVIYYPTNDNIGLFGYIRNATIQDISLLNSTVTGKLNVGGLVGNATSSKFYNSGFSGDVVGESIAGGLAGLILPTSSIDQCFATSNVRVSGTTAGGLVGRLEGNGISILNSFSVSPIMSERGSSTYGNLGGLSGTTAFVATIRNVYTAGLVGPAQYPGGLIGYTGSSSTHPSFVNSYWDLTATKQARPIRDFTQVPGTTGLDTMLMKQQASYPLWDFTNVWAINEGVTYPYLRWTLRTAPWTLIYNPAKGYKIVG